MAKYFSSCISMEGYVITYGLDPFIEDRLVEVNESVLFNFSKLIFQCQHTGGVESPVHAINEILLLTELSERSKYSNVWNWSSTHNLSSDYWYVN